MKSTTREIGGIQILIESAGEQTIIMVHGWPDTHRLWDTQVRALAARYTCVRFTLPGFDISKPPRPSSLQQIVDLIDAIADDVSPDRPVIVLAHDWGCIFGYEFVAQNPMRVARLIGVDIGDAASAAFKKSLSVPAPLMVLFYQGWLAIAWKIGGGVGNGMTRFMARALKCPSDQAHIGVQMNYPYYITFTGALGGYKRAAPLNPQCPMLFIYGKRKPFMFHSPRFVEKLAATQGSAVRGLDTAHWVMIEQPEVFNQCVVDWLAGGV